MPLASLDDSKVLIRKSIWESESKKLIGPLQVEFNKFKEKMDSDLQLMLDKNNAVEHETELKRIALTELTAKVTDSENRFQAIDADVTIGRDQIAQINKQMGEAMAAYQEMCDFARDRAGVLQALDLISDEQLAQLTATSVESKPEGDHLSWKSDLDQDYGKVVSSIHSFLLEEENMNRPGF